MGNVKSFGFVLGGALGGSAIMFAVGFREHGTTPAPPVAEARVHQRLAQPGDGTRAQVAAAVADAVQHLGPAPDERTVGSILSDLDERARRQGVVTALEIEPGLAAIETLGPAIGPDAVQ